jgi:hypothetical protein
MKGSVSDYKQPLISTKESKKLMVCYGMQYKNNDYSNSTQRFIPKKKTKGSKQIRFSVTGD